MTANGFRESSLPTLAAMLALVFLVMLGNPALAQEDKKGFEPGNRTFSNPFANLPPGTPGADAADDEEFPEEFDEELDEFPAPKAPPQRAERPTPEPPSRAEGERGKPGAEPPASRSESASTHSLGGTSAGGVIQHTQAPPSLAVEDESGEGSKELVTDFNFPDADIMDIAKTLGKLTGKNFIFDKDVKGRISIVSNGPITVGDAWKAFLTALDINNFALIPSGKYIRIARQRDARDKQLKTFVGDYSPDSDALITRVFTIKYIDAEEVARVFRNFVSATSRIHPHPQTNTLIVTETGANIAKLAKILDILDIEGYDAGIEVIPVKFASAVELSKLIDTLVPGTGGTPGGPGGAPRVSPGGKFAARRTKEGGIINTIIADERTNTLIVHANQKGADQVRELVARLDQKLPTSTGGGRIHVYFLQFADSKKIADTLNNLTTGAKPAAPAGAAAGGTGTNPVQAALFEGSIKVSADEATNSLVITASSGDYEILKRVIAQLDMPREEVYAEVIIMEMSMLRDFTFSGSLALPSSGHALVPNTDLAEFIASPLSQKGAIIPLSAGKPTEVTISGQKFSVSSVVGLVKALQTHANANVLATPQILALDNSEAVFETAEKIPTLTTTTSQGNVTQSVGKENVSLKITIKPQISKISNYVKLAIKAILEDITERELPKQVAQLGVATVSRSAQTDVFVADGDTVVLGGLVRDVQNQVVSKVPLLGDIPILGWFFSARKTETKKTNLLIFITPHIIKQYEKVRAILDRKLRERDKFIEKHAGGDDPLREYRDNMIRALPDMSDIMNYKPDQERRIGADDDGKPAASLAPGERESSASPKKPLSQKSLGVEIHGAAEPADSGVTTGPEAVGGEGASEILKTPPAEGSEQ